MPRQPKPVQDRVRRNKPKAMDARLVGPAVAAPPAPPAGILATTRHWWDTYWASELSRMVKLTDITSLAQLALLYDERERAQTAIRRTRIESITDSEGNTRQLRVSNRLVPGSKGQPVLNPLIRYVEDLQTDIRALEDRFGLNLKARLSLGLKIEEGMKRLEDLIGEDGDDEDGTEDGRPEVIEIAAAKGRSRGDLAAPPG